MLSVILPAYNEEESVAATVERASRVLPDSGIPDGEVIVVDDGSTDRTAEYASAAGARVISHPCNAGYGRALKTGIQAAKHDVLAIADVDGTYPIEQLNALLTEFNKGYDMVVGARTGAAYGGWVKTPLRSLLRFLVEYSTGQRVPDVNSGMRIFRRSTVTAYFGHLCDTFSFTTSLTLAYLMTGRFVAHVPIPYELRAGRSKVRLFRDAFRTVQYIVQAVTYYNPLKIFLLLSVVCLLLSVISFVFAFITGLLVAYIFGSGNLLLSVLIFGLGLHAVLLKQIMDSRWNKAE